MMHKVGGPGQASSQQKVCFLSLTKNKATLRGLCRCNPTVAMAKGTLSWTPEPPFCSSLIRTVGPKEKYFVNKVMGSSVFLIESNYDFCAVV